MDESSSKDPKDNETSESVDLSALKSFSFGTQWSEAPKTSKGGGRSPRSGQGFAPRGDRPDRRQGGGPPAARRDRRPSRAPREDAGEGARHEEESRSFGRGRQAPPPRPYESPVFDVCFYPEDNCFSAIIKAMRANHLTYELFHVAKLFLEKPDRYISSITRRAEPGQKPEKVFISASDSMPFATEDEVIAHAMAHQASEYFTIEEVEVEPPSGNFTFVSRCPFTKELLGPPNYHKYEQTLRNHHRTRLPRMSFEKLQSSIETVRDEEAVNQWLESQKKATRYTAKVAEGEAAPTFDSQDEALGYLRTTARAKVIKQVSYARVPGTTLEKHRETEAYKAAEGERQRQLRFPLDTANAIRGRMRREKFSIYKKGAKGVTYVCATKRNFRTPGQVMAPDLDRIIRFLESHPMVKAKEFTSAYETWLKTEAPDSALDEKKLLRDLHWLVADGYVSHFEDDSLFAQPILEAGGAHPGEEHHHEKRKGPKARPSEAKNEDSNKTAADSQTQEAVRKDVKAPAATPQADAPAAENAVDTTNAEAAEAEAEEAKSEAQAPAEATIEKSVESEKSAASADTPEASASEVLSQESATKDSEASEPDQAKEKAAEESEPVAETGGGKPQGAPADDDQPEAVSERNSESAEEAASESGEASEEATTETKSRS